MPDSGAQHQLPFLSEETREVLRRVEWRTARRLRGTMTGGHLSPAKGNSQEFAEHRAYAPGDDMRRLDWKVMARTDKDVVRNYVEDSNARVSVLLDVSASMGYQGKADVTKLRYGQELAAALAYLFLQQGDAVGLSVYDQSYRQLVSHSSKKEQLGRILNQLNMIEIGEAGGGLQEAAADLPNGCVVIVIGDLLDPDEVRALHQIGQGRVLVLMQVMAREELSFPFSGQVQFRDLEDHELVPADAGLVRDEYLRLMDELLQDIESVALECGGEWVQAVTDQPAASALLAYLGGRRS